MKHRAARTLRILTLPIVAATMLVACGRDGGRADTGAGTGETGDAPAATEMSAPATDSTAETPAPARAAVSSGDAAPDVTALRADGTPVRLTELRGEVVLLNLWATWCKPCRAEIPALEQVHQEFKPRGLAVVGASLDADVGREQVTGFAQRLGATYAIWMDADDAIAGGFQPLGLPTTFVIDRAGVIRWRHTGPVKADDPKLREVLGQVLAP